MEPVLNRLSCNENSIRDEAMNFITKLKSENYEQYLNQLVDVIRRKKDSLAINHAFILLYQEVEKGFHNIEFCKGIINDCILYMDLGINNLSRAASILLGMVLGVLVRSNIYPQAIEEIWKITSEKNDFFLHNLLTSFSIMLQSTMLNKTQSLFLFHTLIQYLLNPNFTSDILLTLQNMSENIIEAVPIEERQSFLECLLQLTTHPNFQIQCLNVWHRFSRVSFPFIKPVILLLLSITKDILATSDNEELLITSLRLTKSIVNRQIKTNQFFLNFTVFDTFFPHILRILSVIPSTEPNSPEDWNPHLASISLLFVFSQAFPDHSSTIFLPLISNYSQSNNSTFLEISIILLHILLKLSDKLPPIEFVITFLQNCINNSNVRIRNLALSTISSISKKEEYSNHLLKFIPQFISILENDHPFNVILSLRILSKLSIVEGFPYNEIFPIFYIMFHSTNFLIVSVSFDSFFNIVQHIDNIGIVHILIEPTIKLMEESFVNHLLLTFQDEIFELMNLILSKVTISAIEYLPVIYNLYIKNIQSYCLLPICSLAKYYNIEIQNYMNQIVIILENFIVNDSNDLRTLLSCYSLLSCSIYFRPFVHQVTKKLFEMINKLNDQYDLDNIIITFVSFFEYHSEVMCEFVPFFAELLNVENMKLRNSVNVIEVKIENWIDLTKCVLNCGFVDVLQIAFSLLDIVYRNVLDYFDVIDSSFTLVSCIAKINFESLIDFEEQSNAVTWILEKAVEYADLHEQATLFIDELYKISNEETIE